MTTLSAQGAYDDLGVFLEDSQEGFGGASGAPAALLPVLKGVLADPDHSGEMRLGDIDRLSELAYVYGLVFEDPRRFRFGFSDSA